VIGDGHTTTLNGRPVRTRPTRRLEEATLLTSDPLTRTPPEWRAFAALTARAKLVRTWGDCYGYLLVATGWPT